MEWGERSVERLRNWRNVAEVVCAVVKRFLPDASVYVFGSVARGDWSADSDIDMLIVSRGEGEDSRGCERGAGEPGGGGALLCHA